VSATTGALILHAAAATTSSLPDPLGELAGMATGPVMLIAVAVAVAGAGMAVAIGWFGPTATATERERRRADRVRATSSAWASPKDLGPLACPGAPDPSRLRLGRVTKVTGGVCGVAAGQG
jgi:hypothetical protein